MSIETDGDVRTLHDAWGAGATYTSACEAAAMAHKSTNRMLSVGPVPLAAPLSAAHRLFSGCGEANGHLKDKASALQLGTPY